jgi:hypothetical protein
MKCRPAALPVEAQVVPPVVEEPEPEEKRCNGDAVDENGGGELEHPVPYKTKNASKVNFDAFL